MKKIGFPFVLLSIVFIACSNKANTTVVSGKLSNSSGEKIYLDEITTSNFSVKDSAVLGKDGAFKFNLKVPEIGFYRVRLNDRNFALLLLDSLEQVVLTADAKNFAASYRVSGSANSEKIAEANALLQRNYFIGDSLKKVFANYQGTVKMDSVGRALDMQYGIIKQKEAMYLKNFVRNNSSSLASLAIIDQLSSETELETYLLLDKGLSAKYPNSPYTKLFHNRVAEMNKLGIGTVAPDITLATPEGQMVSLSSLRGKVVLVDFWASWCRPCRAENPNVVKAYKAFHDKGFEVLGVSLDKEKNAWVKAIADDHLTWTHISDLGMWNSSVVKLYNITGIPFSVLVDKEGRVVAKGLRGAELESELHKLLP